MKTFLKNTLRSMFMIIPICYCNHGLCVPRILFSECNNNEKYGPLVKYTFKSQEFEFEDMPNLEYIADDPGDYVHPGDFVIDPVFSILPDNATQMFSLKLYRGEDVLAGNYRSRNVAPEYFTINVQANVNFSQWLGTISREIKLFQQGIIKTFRPKVMHLDLVTQPQMIRSLGYESDEFFKIELVDVLRGFKLMSNTYLTYVDAIDTQSRKRFSNNLVVNSSVKLSSRLKMPGKPAVELGQLNCPINDFNDKLAKYLEGIVNKLKSQNIIP